MATVMKDAREKGGNLSEKALNPDLKGIPRQGNGLQEALKA